MNNLEILQNNKYVKITNKSEISYYNIKTVIIDEDEIIIDTYVHLYFKDDYSYYNSFIFASFNIDDTIYEDLKEFENVIITVITEDEFQKLTNKMSAILKETKKKLKEL